MLLWKGLCTNDRFKKNKKNNEIKKLNVAYKYELHKKYTWFMALLIKHCFLFIQPSSTHPPFTHTMFHDLKPARPARQGWQLGLDKRKYSIMIRTHSEYGAQALVC